MNREQLIQLDHRLFQKVNSVDTRVLTTILRLVTLMGYEISWIPFLIIFTIFWTPEILYGICGAYAFGIPIYLIKHFFSRDRPYKVLENVNVRDRKPISSSFPSAHTFYILTITFTIGILLDNWLIMIIAGVLTALTGLSRVYLGVHFPSDVAAGALYGVLAVLILVFNFPLLKVQIIDQIAAILGI